MMLGRKTARARARRAVATSTSVGWRQKINREHRYGLLRADPRIKLPV